MPSAAIAYDNYDASVQTYTLAGSTATGAIFKDATRTLALPATCEYSYKIGAPGSLGNDTLTVKFSNSVQNGVTGKIVTPTVTMVVSVPRDAAITGNVVADMIRHFNNVSVTANIDKILDGIVP